MKSRPAEWFYCELKPKKIKRNCESLRGLLISLFQWRVSCDLISGLGIFSIWSIVKLKFVNVGVEINIITFVDNWTLPRLQLKKADLITKVTSIWWIPIVILLSYLTDNYKMKEKPSVCFCSSVSVSSPSKQSFRLKEGLYKIHRHSFNRFVWPPRDVDGWLRKLANKIQANRDERMSTTLVNLLFSNLHN